MTWDSYRVCLGQLWPTSWLLSSGLVLYERPWCSFSSQCDPGSNACAFRSHFLLFSVHWTQGLSPKWGLHGPCWRDLQNYVCGLWTSQFLPRGSFAARPVVWEVVCQATLLTPLLGGGLQAGYREFMSRSACPQPSFHVSQKGHRLMEATSILPTNACFPSGHRASGVEGHIHPTGVGVGVCRREWKGCSHCKVVVCIISGWEPAFDGACGNRCCLGLGDGCKKKKSWVQNGEFFQVDMQAIPLP